MQALDKIPAETLALLIVRSVYESTDGGPGGTEVSGVSDVQIGTPPGGWSCTAVIEAEGQKETLLVAYDGEQYSDVVQGAGVDEGDRTDAATPNDLVLRAVRVLYGGFENWEVKGIRNLRQGTPAGGLTVEVVILNTDDRKVLRLEGVWDGEEWRDTILSEDTDGDRTDAAKKGKGRAKPNCKKGRPCGGSCIRMKTASGKDTQCRVKPEGAAKEALNRVATAGGSGVGATSGGQYKIPDIDTVSNLPTLGEGAIGKVVLDKRNNVAIKYNKGGEPLNEKELKLSQLAGDLGVGPKVIAVSGDNRAVAIEVLRGYKTFDSAATSMASLSRGDQIQVAKNVVSQLEILHSNRILHNDFHSGNVMFNPRTQDVKIIDYGLANDVFNDAPGSFANFQPLRDISRLDFWFRQTPGLDGPSVRRVLRETLGSKDAPDYQQILDAIDEDA